MTFCTCFFILIGMKILCTSNSIGNHEIVELKGNFIPKDLVPLEILFSKDDTLLKPIVQSIEENVLSYNIGSENEPKMIKISKTLSEKERNMYIKLLKKFVVFLLGHMKI